MWGVLLLLSVFQLSEGATLAPSPAEVVGVSSPLHVGQCRATCLQEIVKEDHQKGKKIPLWECSKELECHVCWRKCEELEMLAQWKLQSDRNINTNKYSQAEGDESESKIKTIKSSSSSTTSSNSKSVASICSTSSCSSGCGMACTFYSTTTTTMASSNPVVATPTSSSVLILSPGKVTWPQGKEEDGPLVYILIQQLPHLKWKQVTQTTQNWALLPKTLWDKLEFGVRSVRVLVVSPKGLVSIYNPVVMQNGGIEVTTSSTTQQPPVDERTWSQMMKVDENYPSRETAKQKSGPLEEEEQEVVTSNPEENVDDIWALRRLSLIHQKSLVIAELAWEDVKRTPEQEYLITWELDGGGLKGHLVTDSTTVSLSLWPDTLYHIQVELFEPNFEEGEQDDASSSSSFGGGGGGTSKSLPLSVDTSEASFPLLVEKPSALLSRERLLTASTLVAVFVAVTLTLGAILLAVSIRRLFSFQGGRASLDKQLLQDDTDDVESGEERNNRKEKQSNNGDGGSSGRRHPTYPHGGRGGVSVISGCGDLLKGPVLPLPQYLGGVGPLFPSPSHRQHHHIHHQQQGGWYPNGLLPSSSSSSKEQQHLAWLNNSASRAPSST